MYLYTFPCLIRFGLLQKEERILVEPFCLFPCSLVSSGKQIKVELRYGALYVLYTSYLIREKKTFFKPFLDISLRGS